MAEYVTKDNMRSRIENDRSDNKLYNMLVLWIDKLPTEDVMPVIHAEWRTIHNGIYECSNCNLNSSRSKFCPHCGALMDGKINVKENKTMGQ